MKLAFSRSLAPFAVTGIILLGLLLGAGCHTASMKEVRPALWNGQLVMNLEAQGETSGPFLSTDPGAGSAGHFKLVSDSQSGVGSLVSGLQGDWQKKSATFATPPLTTPYYLNLSIPVFGVIYVTNSPSGSAAKGVESAQIRVVVRSGDKLVGGDTVTQNVASSSTFGKWIKFPFYFRAETASLDAAQPLSVEVTRLSGLSDMSIGTDGAGSQSFVEFRYFSSDPLSGTVYLERGRFSSSGGEELTESEFQARLKESQASGAWQQAPAGYVHLSQSSDPAGGAGPLAMMAFGALLSIGLVLPRRRPPLKPILTAMLVFTMIFAGCFGGGDGNKGAGATGDPDQPTPTVNQTIEAKPGLENSGFGEIEGFVHDDIGLRIKGAHVALLATNLFGTTDAKGTFRFINVSAGTYLMRVDAEKFAPLEQEVQVVAGSVTKLNITLVYPNLKSSNDKAHVHDDYAGRPSVPFAEDSFTPPSRIYTQEAATPGTWYCDGLWDRAVHGQHRLGCEFPIPIPMQGRTIFPGTSRVEVVLDWASGGNAPKELGLRVITTGNRSIDQVFLARAAGVPFNVAIFPNEADPGHQKFSNWQFFVELPAGDMYHPGTPIYYSGGAISYKITMHRGVVPFEPPHRDFWANLTEIPLNFQHNPLTGQAGGCYPKNAAGSTSAWILAKNELVPPGTKEVVGRLSWKSDYLDAVASAQTAWKLAYLPANGPWSDAKFQIAQGTSAGSGAIDFKIVPKPEETDQFYQAVSNWLFSPEDGDVAEAAGNCYNTAYGTKFTLSAVAVKDPEFKDSA